jgi:mannose-6-phosphate isomerase-like protein (cupin superfamily)
MSDGKHRPHIRRIVTGHDANGKSVVWIDAPATNHKWQEAVPSTFSSTLMWVTDETPTDFLQDVDAGERTLGTMPPAGGSRFCVIEFLPSSKPTTMHRTDAIDYVICISGELDMELDNATVTLRPGDVVVQRGTNHRWFNRGTVPARIGVVLVDGKPKRAGSVSGSANAH